MGVKRERKERTPDIPHVEVAEDICHAARHHLRKLELTAKREREVRAQSEVGRQPVFVLRACAWA